MRYSFSLSALVTLLLSCWLIVVTDSKQVGGSRSSHTVPRRNAARNGGNFGARPSSDARGRKEIGSGGAGRSRKAPVEVLDDFDDALSPADKESDEEDALDGEESDEIANEYEFAPPSQRRGPVTASQRAKQPKQSRQSSGRNAAFVASSRRFEGRREDEYDKEDAENVEKADRGDRGDRPDQGDRTERAGRGSRGDKGGRRERREVAGEEDDLLAVEEDYRRPNAQSLEAKRRQSPPQPANRRPPSRQAGRDELSEGDLGRTGRQVQRTRAGVPPRPPPRARAANSGRVVSYNRRQAAAPGGPAASLTKGWEVLKSSLPDPLSVKDAALSSISAVQQTTSSLSANLYREIKGLTSSELEQVMLKATSPDDTPVKGKHVERLVGVTYQISARYDIYDAVLRKLWSKMAEKDWRTTTKALYILHRFSADGAPEHAPALKARLRELRRTNDPKRKDKFFNSKQLLAGDEKPETARFRAFMARYAHYVLLRAQCFAGMFEEISTPPKPEKNAPTTKPITSTCLRKENLDAAAMLLRAASPCLLKPGEECENTAIALERVVSDMIAMAAAVATALNRALKSDDINSLDAPLIQKWCMFYSDNLLPQTRAMVKKSSPQLDPYGLYLPSRISTLVSPELLERGLALEDYIEESESSLQQEQENEAEDRKSQTVATGDNMDEADDASDAESGAGTKIGSAPVDEDEYEYEEEEYYEEDEL